MLGLLFDLISFILVRGHLYLVLVLLFGCSSRVTLLKFNFYFNFVLYFSQGWTESWFNFIFKVGPVYFAFVQLIFVSCFHDTHISGEFCVRLLFRL